MQRFAIDALKDEFGKDSILSQAEKHSHVTPSGMEQRFVSCLFQLTCARQ